MILLTIFFPITFNFANKKHYKRKKNIHMDQMIKFHREPEKKNPTYYSSHFLYFLKYFSFQRSSSQFPHQQNNKLQEFMFLTSKCKFLKLMIRLFYFIFDFIDFKSWIKRILLLLLWCIQFYFYYYNIYQYLTIKKWASLQQKFIKIKWSTWHTLFYCQGDFF